MSTYKLSSSKGKYTLTLQADGYKDEKERVKYALTREDESTPIFEGNDFGASPLHSSEGEESARALLSFLTLQFGDTDREYFDGYTPRQLEFSASEAEELSLYAIDDGESFAK